MKIELFNAEGHLWLTCDGFYVLMSEHQFYCNRFGDAVRNDRIDFEKEDLKNATMIVDGKKFVEKDGYFVEYKLSEEELNKIEEERLKRLSFLKQFKN